MKVDFFVQADHSLGGVTSWSYQMAERLSHDYETRVVGIGGRSAIETGGPRNARYVTLSGPATAAHVETEFWTGRTRVVGRVLPKDSVELNDDARRVVGSARVYVPNYLEYGYRLAAIARAEGYESRCIGICHTDEEHYYALLERYAPAIDMFVAVSKRCKRKLEKRLGNRKRHVIFLPCGIERAKDTACTKVENRLRLLYAGRLVRRQKRIQDLFELARILDRKNVPYSLDLLGDGPDREFAVDCAMEFSDWVRVLDPVTPVEMRKVYPKYDILLSASEYEGTSISMVEGMVNGLVPIVTRVSGAEDVVENGQNGYLVCIGDADAMACHIASLADDRSLLLKMSERARKSITGIYFIDCGSRVFETIIQEAMRENNSDRQGARACLSA